MQKISKQIYQEEAWGYPVLRIQILPALHNSVTQTQ